MKNDNLINLFTLRFVFDEPNDMVNLTLDVFDLLRFPERLEGSYADEWEIYVKKRLRNQAKMQSINPEDMVESLSIEQRKKYDELLHCIEQALVVANEDKVKVIKTPLKSYIEYLLKL